MSNDLTQIEKQVVIELARAKINAIIKANIEATTPESVQLLLSIIVKLGGSL